MSLFLLRSHILFTVVIEYHFASIIFQMKWKLDQTVQCITHLVLLLALGSITIKIPLRPLL